MIYIPFLINVLIFLFSLGLFFYIVKKIPRSILKTTVLLFLLVEIFGTVYISTTSLNIFVSKEIASMFLRLPITTFMWIIFTPSFFLFIGSFTNKKIILKPIFNYLILLIIPLIFTFQQLSDQLFIVTQKYYYGWVVIGQNSVWLYLYFIFYFVLYIAGVVILLIFSLKTKDLVKKKEAVIFFLVAVFNFIWVVYLTVVFRKIGRVVVLADIDTSALLWMIVIIYSIKKYKFLTITLAEAADKIINLIPDMLFVADNTGKIIRINESVTNILGYKKDEIIELPFGQICNFQKELLNHLKLNKKIINKPCSCWSKEKEEIPVLISAIVGSDQNNVSYLIFLLKEARDIKKYAESRLKVLSPVLTKVTGGDFSEKINVPEIRDEFTEHIIALNNMIDGFANLVDLIDNKSQKLEAKNKNLRTASLEFKRKLNEIERFKKITSGREVRLLELKKENIRLKGNKMVKH